MPDFHRARASGVAQGVLGVPQQEWGSMSSSVVTSDSYGNRTARRPSIWTRDYVRRVAVADLGCAVLGVFAAAQLRFGDNVTPTYLILSLSLPVVWLIALTVAGAYDVRFIGTGSDEFRKVLNAGVGLTAAAAILSYAVNIRLSRGYLL